MKIEALLLVECLEERAASWRRKAEYSHHPATCRRIAEAFTELAHDLRRLVARNDRAAGVGASPAAESFLGAEEADPPGQER